MKEPLIPQDEAARLAALRSTRLLELFREDRFDRLTNLTAKIFQVPIAVVSIIDANRQWCKSCFGIAPGEAPRHLTFCAHAILNSEILVVEDAFEDERFFDNPFVLNSPSVRFYAGCPLSTTDGYRIGTLCIVDTKPRRNFDDLQQSILRDLANIVAKEINAVELNQAIRNQLASELTLTSLLTHVADGIVTLNGNGMIESFNPAAEHMFGYKAKDVIDHDVGMLVLEDISKLSKKSKNAHEQEFTGRRCDGSTFPLEFSISPIQLDSNLKFTIVIRDISRRKEAEAKMQRVDQLRRKFFATAAHELRTPLTTIHGFTELLMERSFAEETRSSLISRTHHQVTRVLMLLDEMLNLARLEAGIEESFDLKPHLLDEVIEQAVMALGLKALDRIVVEFKDVIPKVICDSMKLQQALMNVISNALKYSPEEEKVLVTIYKSKYHKNNVVCISIDDQGVGMTPDEINHVFDWFYRANPQGKVAGTGLGMSIVKEIIDLHHGSIEINSRPSQGTRVTIQLPVQSVHYKKVDTTTSFLEKSPFVEKGNDRSLK